MAATYEESIAGLRKAAEGDGEEAAKARRMLAAMDEEDKGADGESDEDPPAAEGDEAPSDEEPKKDEEESKASAESLSLAQIAKIAMEAKAEAAASKKQLEAAQRREIRASRPDVPKGIHDALSALPVEKYRAQLALIEKPKRPNPAAVVTPAATRGESSGTEGPRLAPEAKRDLDRRMGLLEETRGVVKVGNKLILGGIVEAGKAG